MKRNNKNSVNATENTTVKTVTCKLEFKAKGKDAEGITIEQRVFEPANFTRSLAEVLKEFEQDFILNYLGYALKVPALTKSNSNLERAIKIFQQFTEKLFPSGMERIEVITPKDTDGLTLNSLKSMGIKFDTLCKKEVIDGVNKWVALKKAKINNIAERVRTNHIQEIALTKCLNEDTKVRKAKNLAAITGLQVGYVKEGNFLTLPEAKK